MDKHRELHDILVTQRAGVEGLEWDETADLDGYWHSHGYPEREWGGWFDNECDPDHPISMRQAHALIEHAAILWLYKVGYGIEFDPGDDIDGEGADWQVSCYGWKSGWLPLIDAIHKAVKREVGSDG
jgi:hypothetical protein